ncbi:outer membrane lipoprotein carrier protein LolA [Streptomyces sp. NPDC057654]|uniref:LolA family protein n=1 Tax=Streptomyces sp. NPDC057654 TaxID=3346196 RepID=UPI00368FA5FD
MPRIRPTHEADGAGEADHRRPGRRKAVRYGVPVAVAGVAAATIGLVPALASSGDPDLPKITAQDLIAKVAASDTQQLSGSVKISTDLGLPSLPSGMSFGGGGGGGGGGGNSGKDGGSDASPQAKLTELAAGTHTLRVAADGPDKQRLSIEEKAAEYSLIHNGDQLWGYDSASNSAYHATVPKDASAKGKGSDASKGLRSASPQELAKQALAAVDDSTSVSVDGTAKVAGRDAYQLSIKPKQSGSTVESVRISVDAKNGVPLKVTVNPKSGGKPVVDAGFTKVDFGKPAASTFDFTPPKGTKVTEAKDAKAKADRKGGSDLFAGKGAGEAEDWAKSFGGGAKGDSEVNVTGKGWASIAEISMPKGSVPGGKDGKSTKGSGDASGLMDSFGKKVSGKFGSGHVFSTRLVNALLTDDGKLYVGAVDKDALVSAANKAASSAK